MPPCGYILYCIPEGMNSPERKNEVGMTGGKALLACAGALLVFAVLVCAVTFVTRARMREQIVGRDAAVLSSVAGFEVDRARVAAQGYPAYVGSQTEEDGLLEALLDVSRLGGLGWRARIGLEEGLARTYDDFLHTHALPACEVGARAA